uniref:Dynein heavy chain C-terminal domain-containing protein n=1 Tax=Coccolithus braarudii TaxID=221442 RepID=A0A7S0Q566_9EUKA
MSQLLTGFVNEDVLGVGYQFSPSGVYKTIGETDMAAYAQYVTDLPVNASPEVFGLHENADITCAQNDTNTMFATILSLQPRAASAGGKTQEELLTETANDILGRVPALFNLESVVDNYPTMYEDSMNTVLQQECIRYNKVIAVLLRSLKDVVKALKGEVVMTAELETMGHSLFNNQVPEMWSKAAYPSLKPLATWVPDLCARLNFIQRWIDEGKPSSYWLSGFYFPQAFITGTKQNHARKYQLPIDTITFGYRVWEESSNGVYEAPKDGALVYGLFLEGARWDPAARILRESRAKELFTTLPPIHLHPIANRPTDIDGIYHTPVYKTMSRFGTLSTTGHSTNFVMTIEIPSDLPQTHWVKRGVAGLCSLNY